MAVSYRQLERPTLIDVGMRSGDSGAASLAQSFAEFNNQVRNTAAQVGTAFAEKLGEEKGAQAGREGEPAFRRGLRSLTAYGRAYNNAATRTYALRAEQDINETAARLEVEAANDPEKFRTSMDAARRATVGAAASDEARAVVNDLYTRRLGAGTERLIAAQATELRNDDRSAVAESTAQMIERIGLLRSQGDELSHLQADEEMVKFNLMVDGAVGDGTLTEVEGASMRRQFQRDVVRNSVTQQLQNELNDPNGDPLSMIETVIEVIREDQTLLPEEEAKLVNEMFTALADRNNIRSQRAAQEAAAVEARYDAGDQEATALLLSGTLTQSNLLQMVENDEIRPALARTLLNELQAGAAARAPKSDPEELFHVETNLLSMSEEEIATNQGLVWADRSRLIQKRRDESEGWKSTQVAREAFDRIDRALGIVPGLDSKFLTEDERRARDEALTELYELVDALPEEERQGAVLAQARDVIQRRISDRAATEVARLRDAMARYREGKDPARMNEVQRADFDAQIARYETRIREQEAKVQP